MLVIIYIYPVLYSEYQSFQRKSLFLTLALLKMNIFVVQCKINRLKLLEDMKTLLFKHYL